MKWSEIKIGVKYQLYPIRKIKDEETGLVIEYHGVRILHKDTHESTSGSIQRSVKGYLFDIKGVETQTLLAFSLENISRTWIPTDEQKSYREELENAKKASKELLQSKVNDLFILLDEIGIEYREDKKINNTYITIGAGAWNNHDYPDGLINIDKLYNILELGWRSPPI